MAIEVPEAIRRLLNGDHELWKQHVLEAYNIGMCENAARHETGDKGMSETIPRHGGIYRSNGDGTCKTAGEWCYYDDHLRVVEALEAENVALRAKVQRQSAPVSDIERAMFCLNNSALLTYRLYWEKEVNSLIAARAYETQQPSPAPGTEATLKAMDARL